MSRFGVVSIADGKRFSQSCIGRAVARGEILPVAGRLGEI